MGSRVVQQIAKILRELPPDTRTRTAGRDLVLNSGSLLRTVGGCGVTLSPAETKFFKQIPPAIDGAIRGVIHDTLATKRGRINFDIAYRAVGTGYALTISSDGRSSDVEVVLQAPTPGGKAGSLTARAPAKKRKAQARKRKAPTKGRRAR